jgi:hypothetical protein
MRFSRGRGKRLNHHGPGGRFLTPTVESAFGLRVKICPHCRGITTLTRREDVFPDGSMHVYYTPTHWREMPNSCP